MVECSCLAGNQRLHGLLPEGPQQLDGSLLRDGSLGVLLLFASTPGKKTNSCSSFPIVTTLDTWAQSTYPAGREPAVPLESCSRGEGGLGRA